MILLYATIALAILCRALGTLGLSALNGWRAATRVAMGCFFCFTGVAHFTAVRADLINMVPPGFPDPPLLVSISGVAELAGGIGLLMPRFRRAAALCLIALLVVLFPANVHAAREGILVAGARHPTLIVRAFMQLAWIGMVWWSTREPDMRT